MFLSTLNFSSIKLILTDEYVSVYYGLFGTKLKWSDIKFVEIDEKKHFYGYGIRFGKYKDKWVWVYNVIGGTRVVFGTEASKPKGLIISTKNPDEVIRIGKEKINI